jgi:DNA uptake protein ComE-like DNA-binding protein
MKRMPWWVWASMAPLGVGAWASIVPGRELRRRWWIALGLFWSAATIVGWVIAPGALGGFFIILGWIGAIATTLSIRGTYERETASPFLRGRRAAEQRLEERREAQKLALENPALALELGIGRPDRRGSQHVGLVDVNNAPVEILNTLPGVGRELAKRIVQLRDELDGFSSVNDLGNVLDLDGHAVERLRDRVVFLPR